MKKSSISKPVRPRKSGAQRRAAIGDAAANADVARAVNGKLNRRKQRQLDADGSSNVDGAAPAAGDASPRSRSLADLELALPSNAKDALHSKHRIREGRVLQKLGFDAPRSGSSGNASDGVSRFFDLRFILRKVLNDEIREHEADVPASGYGTLAHPDNPYDDEAYPACGLLLLGFFCFVPWFLGSCYLRSRNPSARSAGIISSLLSVLTFLVILLVYFDIY